MARLLVLMISFVAVLAACEPTPEPADVGEAGWIALTGMTLIDGVSDASIADAVILLEGDRVVAAGPAAAVSLPADIEVISLPGKTVIPGIVNLHAHVGRAEGMAYRLDLYSRERVERDLHAYLHYGITHMVSLGNDQAPGHDVIADQRAGRDLGVQGARMYTAGFGFSAPDGWLPDNPFLNRPSTPDEARTMIQGEAAKGVDLIKLWVDDGRGRLPQFSPEVSGAIIEEAHAQGLKVLVHLYALEEAKELIRRGVDGLAHSIRDHLVDEEFLTLARDRGIIALPALVGHGANLAYADGPDFLDDPALPLLFPDTVLEIMGSREYQEGLADAPNLVQTRQDYAMAAANALRMHEAGIPLGIGTDSGPPGRFQGLWEHREMELLVEAGLSPLEAIRAATLNGARFLGIQDDFGSIEAGKVADLVILDADPLEDIRNSRRIHQVWMAGRPVDRGLERPSPGG
jgi:imidazolonepropionase-like amidohydrolase